MNRWERIEDRPDISVSEEMVLAAVTYGAHTVPEVADMTGCCYDTARTALLSLLRAKFVMRPEQGRYYAVAPHRWPRAAKRAPVAATPPASSIRPLSTQVLMGAHVRRMPLTVSTP